jgi:hypothetical protein
MRAPGGVFGLMVFGLIACSKADAPANERPAASVQPPEGSVAPAAPAPVPTYAVPAAAPRPPLAASDRKRILTGISQLQRLVQQRLGELRAMDDNACQAHIARITPVWEQAKSRIGSDLLAVHTRFADRAPNIGQSVESAVWSCLPCITHDDVELSAPGDDIFAEMREACANAIVALDDLETGIKNAP